MGTDQILQVYYQAVRSQFFPRWDRKGIWQVTDVWNLPSDGRCDTKQKRIYVRSDRIVDTDELTLLLIHEICHAFHPNHGAKWCQRIQKAADTARRSGRHHLAKMLYQEAEEYYSDRMPRAMEIYNTIKKAVFFYPDVEYGELIRYLAFEQGLYRAEFEKKYSLCRKAFEEAILERTRYS